MTFTSFEVCYCAGAAEYDNVVKRLTSRDGLELAAKTSHQVAMSIDGFRFLTIKDRKEQPPTLQLIVDDLEDYCASLPAGVEFERKCDKVDPRRTHNIVLTKPNCFGVRISVRGAGTTGGLIDKPCVLHVGTRKLKQATVAWRRLGFDVDDARPNSVILSHKCSSLRIKIHETEEPMALKLHVDTKHEAWANRALRSHELKQFEIVRPEYSNGRKLQYIVYICGVVLAVAIAVYKARRLK